LPGLPGVAKAASQFSDSKTWLLLEPPLLAGAETVRATWLVTTQFGHWSWSPTVVDTKGLKPALASADRASLNFWPTTLGALPAEATPLQIKATAPSEVAAATPHAVFIAAYPALIAGAALIVGAVDVAGAQVWVAPMLTSGTCGLLKTVLVGAWSEPATAPRSATPAEIAPRAPSATMAAAATNPTRVLVEFIEQDCGICGMRSS
jgi:hypothetical protein